MQHEQKKGNYMQVKWHFIMVIEVFLSTLQELEGISQKQTDSPEILPWYQSVTSITDAEMYLYLKWELRFHLEFRNYHLQLYSKLKLGEKDCSKLQDLEDWDT